MDVYYCLSGTPMDALAIMRQTREALLAEKDGVSTGGFVEIKRVEDGIKFRVNGAECEDVLR